jgi:hypothetical protein
MRTVKITLLIFSLNSVGLGAFSQSWVLDDSIKVEFDQNNYPQVRIVSSQDDLTFKIVLTNMSKKPVDTYAELVYDGYPSLYANYYWTLYQRIDSDYNPIPSQIGSSGLGDISIDLYNKYEDRKKVDSILAVYDISKVALLPGKSDTLRFNLLMDRSFFEPGDYGVQFFLRAGNSYAMQGDTRKNIGRGYVYSKTYYFKVTKRLQIDLKNLPLK